MKNIYPCLWFDDQAENAVKFYVSIFKNSKIGTITRYTEASSKVSGRPKESVMVEMFQLEGQDFMALNGGPQFQFTRAISFFVGCETTREVDILWKKLSVGGKVLMELDKYPFSERYGWIQDKFGVSWQIILGKYEQKITPLLFYAGSQRGKAKEAINYYNSLFSNSKITKMELYTKDEGDEGFVKHASFELSRQKFMAMDSHNDSLIEFNESISLVVNCEVQKEIDEMWDKLSMGGEKGQCGWLKDGYGVSWQIVPTALGEMEQNADAEQSERLMNAVISMTKLDINELRRAYDGNTADKNADEKELVITHIVDAPHDMVWKALTESEQLKYWWGPKGFTTNNIRLDLHKDGVYHYRMTSPEGNEMWGKFVYKDIIPLKRLVFINSFSDEKGSIVRNPMSATWPLEVFNTLELSEQSGKTTIILKGHPINASETELKTFEEGRDSIRKGFEGTWEQLDSYLEKVQHIPNIV